MLEVFDLGTVGSGFDLPAVVGLVLGVVGCGLALGMLVHLVGRAGRSME